ncbi:hypothetical protein RB653_007836 [Dictyostelium firmibasis]|uniref:Transmembrane protein n=1 Tax=Dictyostelium firmibasis TaxID=79012 RepID=A0AAN7TMG3_9MYCE
MSKSKSLLNNNNNKFAVLGEDDDEYVNDDENEYSSNKKSTKKNKNNKSKQIESSSSQSSPQPPSLSSLKQNKKNKKEKVSSDEDEEKGKEKGVIIKTKSNKKSNDEKEKLDKIERDRLEIPPAQSMFNQVVTIFICILLTVILYASPKFLGEFISLGGSFSLGLLTLYLIKELVMPVTKDVNKFKTLYVINQIQELRKEKSILKNNSQSASNDKKLKYIKTRINELELEFEQLDSKNNNNNNNKNTNTVGFFGFIGSLIVFLIKTPFFLAFFLLKLIFHPISILVGLIALYLFYTSGEKKDIPFVPKLVPSFNPKTQGSHSGTKGAKGIVKSKHG